MNENVILNIFLNHKPTPLALDWIDRWDEGLHFQPPRILAQTNLGQQHKFTLSPVGLIHAMHSNGPLPQVDWHDPPCKVVAVAELPRKLTAVLWIGENNYIKNSYIIYLSK
jgi:hypothetical protein